MALDHLHCRAVMKTIRHQKHTEVQTTDTGPQRLSGPQAVAAPSIRDSSHVVREPVDSAAEDMAASFNYQENVTGRTDKTKTRPVASTQRGLCPAFLERAKELCKISSLLSKQKWQETHDTPPISSMWRDLNHNCKNYRNIGWMLKFTTCKYYDCALFRRELEGLCSVMKNSSGREAPFERKRPDTSLEIL